MVQSEDLPSIYEVPVNMQSQGLDAAILRKVGEPVGETPALGPWRTFLERRNKATKEVHIGLFLPFRSLTLGMVVISFLVTDRNCKSVPEV